LRYATIFKRVLDILRIKQRDLKGKNKWEIPGVNYTHDKLNAFTPFDLIHAFEM